jgi:hypothetical protein
MVTPTLHQSGVSRLLRFNIIEELGFVKSRRVGELRDDAPTYGIAAVFWRFL